jgi:hypothetical protein
MSYILDDIIEDFTNYVQKNGALVCLLSAYPYTIKQISSDIPLISSIKNIYDRTVDLSLLPSTNIKTIHARYLEYTNFSNLKRHARYGSISQLMNLDNIDTIQKLSNKILVEAQTIKNIEEIDVHYIYNDIMFLQYFTNLKKISVDEYYEDILVALDNCKLLEELKLMHRKYIVSNDINNFQKLKILITLGTLASYISLPEIEHIEAKSIRGKIKIDKTCKKLKILKILSNMPKDSHLTCDSLTKLNELYYTCGLENSAIETLIPNIKKLSLPNHSDDTSFIKNLKDLEYLNIYHITDAESISSLPKLKQLVIFKWSDENNKLNSESLEELTTGNGYDIDNYIGNLPLLRKFISCKYYGNIFCLSNCPNLEYLEIKYTKYLEPLIICNKLKVVKIPRFDGSLKPLAGKNIEELSIYSIEDSFDVLSSFSKLVCLSIEKCHDKDNILRDMFSNAYSIKVNNNRDEIKIC